LIQVNGNAAGLPYDWTGNRPGIGGGNAMRTMSDIVRDQRPLMLPPGATVMQAARHMRERRVGAVLVTEGDRELVGIFTGRDAVSRVIEHVEQVLRPFLGRRSCRAYQSVE